MIGKTQEFKSIRVERVGRRVQIVMANGDFGMSPREAETLAAALIEMAARPERHVIWREPIELWSEGTIGEKVEA
jgi:hypothetical protein